MNLAEILDKLQQNALKVSQNLVDYEPMVNSELDITIKQLKSRSGIEISLEDIELQGNVWTYKGHHVLLFIPDQGFGVDKVIAGNKEGRKYHLTDCKKIDEMKTEGRFGRYKVTNNTEGIFAVYGRHSETGETMHAEVRLNVCKLCLGRLNYQGYPKNKVQVYNNFDLDEFLETYRTHFKTTPANIGQDKAGYANNWEEISHRYRERQAWRCEQCQVDLSNHKSLLHTHHIDGVKHHNKDANLKALCIECHSKQPSHGHMRVSYKDGQLLQDLRRQQGIFRY
ncbi:hypothetical protein MOMA_00965 [Moraxella macacae 0408225]|uniref:HNH nuclease domain-containing protein n=1 Tax=Moraxella macacae 0408225 TaxID=1230338 RepID=L2F8Z0_9GAMM|nr:HNH endonuclease signature motif containing protein [Moraxella macacae]ELA08938.1 hypothetical protein MOMA_00965 [Moraxella macacae 0408225]